MIRFRFDHSLVLPDFLNVVCKSTRYQNWVVANRQGTARANINAQQFASYEIPLPPLEEQKRIVEDVNVYFSKAHSAKAIMNKTTFLKQEILDEYLK